MRNINVIKNAQYEQMDRRGVINYTSGNAEFDEKIIPELIRSRPQEMDFVDRYGPQEIADDLKRVEEIENSPEYKKSRPPVSAAAEYAVVASTNRQALLGKKARAKMTSRFDDVLNGADTVVWEQTEAGELKYALDITVAKDDTPLNKKLETLDKKLASELIRLRKNNPTKLKYFPDIEGPINRYVIGIPENQAKTLIRGLIREDKTAKDELALAAIALEFNDELTYAAFRQIDYILRVNKLRGKKSKDTEELLKFLKEKEEEIKKQLAPEIWQSVATSRTLIIAKQKQRQALIEQKKGVADIVSQSSRFEPTIRHLLTFDPDQVLVRVA